MKNVSYFQKQGLYDPAYEHESCGVGFVVNVKGRKSHEIVRNGIQTLVNLSHRGAAGCDPETGDGAGILTQIPDKFFRKQLGHAHFELPTAGRYGVGMMFLPSDAAEQQCCEEWVEVIVQEEGQLFLGWRDVPHDLSKTGEIARSAAPAIKQVFIARGSETLDQESFDRKLYIIRKKFEAKVIETDLTQKERCYFCSLSSKTLVYKGQLKSEQLSQFYPDLSNPDFISAIAVVHSRYSTNTFPSWKLAHPYRMLCHNGEINTLRGNMNRMRSRETDARSQLFGNELHKVFPVIIPGGSDSAMFDNVLEFLVLTGRDLPHAMMMMVPEAWSGDDAMEPEKKDFYDYHSCIMEPWDGPALIAFSNGRFVGAMLDRNGLRPARYCIMNDDTILMSSETGVLPIAEEDILYKGRLQSGKMLLIDTEVGRLIEDRELKLKYTRQKPYGRWIRENMVDIDELPEPTHVLGGDPETLLERQRAFGYTREDVKLLLYPKAVLGLEATGSMGNDTSLAVLSEQPQPLFSYFKQLFAQVTNPPIDSIREEIVMTEETKLGIEQNCLEDGPGHCRRLRLKRPIITNNALAKIREVQHYHLNSTTLSLLFQPTRSENDLENALEHLFQTADKAIEQGYTLLILSDRGVDHAHVPIPILLACSGLHHYLIRQGTRNKVSLLAETGEARDMHHFALLIGYGVHAVNPYLALETIEDEIEKGHYPSEIDSDTAKAHFLNAMRKGLFKIISKMGISTIQSYCGAQIFEAVGLDESFAEKYFTGTPSRIGGIGLKELQQETIMRHAQAYKPRPYRERSILDVGGNYQWRKDGEFHQINPEIIAALQHAVRTGSYQLYKEYAALVNDPHKNCSAIRSLLTFKPGTPIPLNDVEPASEIVKRFATAAMSFGSISREAHETIAIAMNRLGGFSNTGEGGEDPDRYTPDANGNCRRSRVKQVAPGRFGVNLEYLINADQIQIKMAQGAKPGEGGQLPGRKVSREIARTRRTIPGVMLISPPPHHDIYSIEDLAQLIFDLKNANTQADIGVKLASEIGVGIIAAGVAKGKADHVLISGCEGGTGASPQSSIKYAGLPMELGIAETQQVLVKNNLRGRIRVQTDGQLKTGRDVVIAAMLGADEFGFGSIVLVTLGCVMLRKCHLDACSMGIATQKPELRRNFAGKPEHVMNFFMFLAEECREIMAELGFHAFHEMIGRIDMLKPRGDISHWKAKNIDLSKVLYQPEIPEGGAIRHIEKQQHSISTVLDKVLIEHAKDAIDNEKPVYIELPIHNTDRAVGTMLSAEITRKYGDIALPEDTVNIRFTGSAGQSFGAFLARGVTMTLEGDANDYVGKGLSGGKIILYPSKHAEFAPENNIIAGNVILYGAIIGEMYIRGMVGERFAVRNSGAKAVVEGVGDHGCEYMTGGRVVILGPAGRNFAAGMSGGMAYVWDQKQTFARQCNLEMVDLFPIRREEDRHELQKMIRRHYGYTHSEVAKYILEHWKDVLPQFVKVYPKEYRRVIEEG
ncbi:glutamate synthase (Ferredoxin) [Candidatus Vecturithrix granuli]|uniref:Glutamate synthase (Ferredoxin) n=1 Tax=Vecturithrix granuli TaxID=1499967 RepID=A0A081C3V8_VECG1|nr:glutamate synthase (Ferredoxin) [Candidatus Vecturithrix granuli]